MGWEEEEKRKERKKKKKGNEESATDFSIHQVNIRFSLDWEGRMKIDGWRMEALKDGKEGWYIAVSVYREQSRRHKSVSWLGRSMRM